MQQGIENRSTASEIKWENESSARQQRYDEPTSTRFALQNKFYLLSGLAWLARSVARDRIEAQGRRRSLVSSERKRVGGLDDDTKRDYIEVDYDAEYCPSPAIYY